MPSSASSAHAEDVARCLLSAWNARDVDGFVALLADDVEWYDPAMPAPPIQGREGVRAFVESVLEAFPDFEYRIQGPTCSSADGSRCTIVWTITATHTRPLRPLGWAPTRRRAVIEGVDVIDVREGRVTRILTAFDALPVAEQFLGLTLRPRPGTLRAWAAVAVQRGLAWLARRGR